MRHAADTPFAALLDELADRIAQHVAALLAEELRERESGQQSPWLSVERAAAYLDWPKQRLYKLTAQNAIPHVKHEGRLLFNRSELDHWLRQHAQGPPRFAETPKQSY